MSAAPFSANIPPSFKIQHALKIILEHFRISFDASKSEISFLAF